MLPSPILFVRDVDVKLRVRAKSTLAWNGGAGGGVGDRGTDGDETCVGVDDGSVFCIAGVGVVGATGGDTTGATGGFAAGSASGIGESYLILLNISLNLVICSLIRFLNCLSALVKKASSSNAIFFCLIALNCLDGLECRGEPKHRKLFFGSPFFLYSP